MRAALVASLQTLAAVTAYAGEPSAAVSSIPASDPLEEVVVVGHYEFLAADTSGTTNLPLPVEKVPQSISLIDADFIKAADFKTLKDIADYTPGAVNAGNSEGFGTYIDLREFGAANALDGVNFSQITGANYALDFAIMDRIEIVKGPSSVVYGVTSAGGVANYVTKNPSSTTPSYVSLQAGSWNTWRFEGQAAGTLDPSQTLHGMAVVVRDQGDSFIHHVGHDHTTVYAGISADITPDLTAFIHGGFDAYNRTADDGVPTEADGSLPPVSRSFFIGSERMMVRTQVYHAETNITWHPTAMLDVSLKGNVINSTGHATDPYSCCLDAAGNLQLALDDHLSLQGWDNGVALSAVYRLDDLGLKQSFLTINVLRQDDRFRALNSNVEFDGQPSGTANLYAGESAISAAFDSAVATSPHYLSDQTLRTLTLSLQSVVQVIDHVSILLGAASAHPKVTNLFDSVDQGGTVDHHTTFRGALMFEPLPGLNSYASFSQSFNPQLLYSSQNNLLAPLMSDQYEVGVKYRPPDLALLLSAAAFRITEKNEGQYVDTINGFDHYAPIGQVSHRGVEAAALGHLSEHWQVNAGYSYIEALVDTDSDPTLIGRAELYIPKHTASVFSTYALQGRWVAGLSLGAGVRFVGAEHTSYDGSTRAIPNSTLVDVLAEYTWPGWALQFNAHNVFDKHYFASNYGSVLYGNDIGPPTSVELSIKRSF